MTAKNENSEYNTVQSVRFRERRSRKEIILQNLKEVPFSAWFGITVILLYCLVAIFAPLIAPYGEAQIVAPPLAPMSGEHILGSDQIGRDILSRLIFGARNTMGIAVITTILSFLIGVSLGLIAAILGGWTDQVFSRIVDTLMAIPSLIFALMLLAIFGSNVLTLIVIIAILDCTRIFRLTRAVASTVTVMEYVEFARLRGEKLPWIMRREILPNIWAPLAAEFGLRFSFVFLTIAALSFLGLGIQPPLADWGSMVRETASLIQFARIDLVTSLTPIIPAATIGLLTVAVNLVVDWFLNKSSGLE